MIAPLAGILVMLAFQVDAPRPAKEVRPEIRAEFQKRKARMADTAAAHWQLGLWCEQSKLPDEALAEFAAVVALDPKRDAAWKRLGYKKVEGKWMSAAQIAAASETKKAVKEWGEKLAAVHKQIHGGRNQAEAEAALSRITDERALPALWQEFGRGATDQCILVQILGQVNAPRSSRTLAFLSVYGANADVRARATESLRGRDPAQYADDLVALLVDPLKFEVKQVNGPGSPGMLFVEGDEFNERRFYRAQTPAVGFMPGDLIEFDANGSPFLMKAGPTGSAIVFSGGKATGANLGQFTAYSLRDLELEGRKSALATQNQLASDVRAIEQMNSTRVKFRAIVTSVLKDATGKNAGEDRKSWVAWLAELKGSGPPTETRKPTLDRVMPTAYTPVAFGQTMFLQVPVPDH